MIEQIHKSIAGRVKFKISGGRWEDLLNHCIDEGVSVHNISPIPEGIIAESSLPGYHQISRHSKIYRCETKIIEKHGIYFQWMMYRYRYGILAGVIIGLAFLAGFRNLIWNICFYDFTPQQEAQLRVQLFEKGIYEGAYQNPEKLMRAAGEIFVQSEEYGAIALNYIKGRLAVEKTKSMIVPEPVSREYTDVIAKSDGIVQKINLISGYPAIKPGQFIAKGDMLVRGMTISEYGFAHYTHAQASVQAKLKKNYLIRQPLGMQIDLPRSNPKRYYAFYFPWGKIKLYNEKNHTFECGKVYRYPAVPLGFHLPVLIEETEIRDIRKTKIRLSRENAEAIARSKILDQIRDEYGQFRIISETSKAETEDDVLRLELCIEMESDIAYMVSGGQTESNAEK